MRRNLRSESEPEGGSAAKLHRVPQNKQEAFIRLLVRDSFTKRCDLSSDRKSRRNRLDPIPKRMTV